MGRNITFDNCLFFAFKKNLGLKRIRPLDFFMKNIPIISLSLQYLLENILKWQYYFFFNSVLCLGKDRINKQVTEKIFRIMNSTFLFEIIKKI